MDVRVEKAGDTELEGKMTYKGMLVKEPDGSYRIDPEHSEKSTYSFTFNRLSNRLQLLYREGDAKGAEIKYHLIDFRCQRVTP